MFIWKNKRKFLPKNKKRFLPASFTVESAFIIPLVIFIIFMGMHIAYELLEATIEMSKNAPAVEKLEPVEEQYKRYGQGV